MHAPYVAHHAERHDRGPFTAALRPHLTPQHVIGAAEVVVRRPKAICQRRVRTLFASAQVRRRNACGGQLTHPPLNFPVKPVKSFVNLSRLLLPEKDPLMLLTKVLHQVVANAQSIMKELETQVKAWTKPTTDSLVVGTAADLVKSKEQLIMENALLRQQVIVLKRQVACPQLTAKDRSLLVVLASRVRDWKNALLIVKPDTVLRWHREGFKLFWWRKSKGKARKPRISEETIALIKQMAVDNRRWGTKRIRGELLKLGIRVNKGTVRRYMWQARRKLPPRYDGQNWATFLANHASEIWACDFVQTYDLF
jgi:hypothetical protein